MQEVMAKSICIPGFVYHVPEFLDKYNMDISMTLECPKGRTNSKKKRSSEEQIGEVENNG